LLTTLNATYQHCAFGLRYLYANLGELQSQARIVEFTLNQKPRDIVESLLAYEPQIVGIGVYIWNTSAVQEVVSLLKKVAPEVCVVLGGPEVSYETESQPLYSLADYIVQGEGEFIFRDFCMERLSGKSSPPDVKTLKGSLPDVKAVQLPYAYYTDEDLKNRILYVEASRGCPYKCEFCLSSLDTSVRNFPLPEFLAEMDRLIQRGARQFKFVDRTFNLSPTLSTQILDFFLARVDQGLFLHFEMVPDRLPDILKERIKQFPAGSLQFEIGIQTWSPKVAALVSRRQDYAKVMENFQFLTEHTKVHIHADLIVGLPGETLDSFAEGFDKLARLNPDEIQVGILKRLKGTPILRHDAKWQMAYQDSPPFTVLKTSTMDFKTIGALDRFAKFWDLYVNSGNFTATMGHLKAQSEAHSWFWQFWEFSAYLNARHPQRYAIALVNLVESAWCYLTTELQQSPAVIRELLIKDYTGVVKRDVPAFLRDDSAPDNREKLRRLWRHEKHGAQGKGTFGN